MSFYNKKRNTNIATLIRNFENKESGKVAVSRQEIKRRFEHLDWRDQKKIIKLFLAGIASDRDWVYKKLLSAEYWDESFASVVQSLWETHHEEVCSWIVIKYLPEEYLLSHLQELSSKENYPFLCRRLWKHKGFTVDRTRMSAYDYYLFLRKTEQRVEEDEARDLFFEVIHEGCLNEADNLRFAKMPNGFFELHSPKDFEIKEWQEPGRYFRFRKAEKLLNTLSFILSYSVCCDLEDWEREVNKRIIANPEFQQILRVPLSQEEFATRTANIALETYYTSLDDKYKSPTDPPIENLKLKVTGNG